MPLAAMDSGGGGSRTPNILSAPASATQRAATNILGRLQAPQPQYRPSPVVPTNTGRYSQPIAPPAERQGSIPQVQQAPNIEAFLGGDTGYQGQLRQFGQALNDFLADLTRRRGTLETDFGTSKKAQEDQRVRDLESLEEDYGSRGLLRSGLYGKAVGDYETEYGQRVSDLSRRQQEALGALQQEEGTFKSQQQLKEQAAREAAVRRRAEQFGL